MKYINALVTLYYPQDMHIENVRKIAKQSDKIYVWDNSPYNNSNKFLDIDNLVYRTELKNHGLSGAFNNILKKSDNKFTDDEYVVFFDQDSVVPENHIIKLISEYESIEKRGFKVGCLGPVFYNTSNNRIEMPKDRENISKNSYIVKSLITSSMITKYGILKDIGFWNEDIFLDMADWELSWRIMKHGYLCCMSNVSILKHSVGEGQVKIGPIRMRLGKPIREYYQTRDCLVLLTQKYVPLKFKIRFLFMLSFRPLLHLIFFNEKGQRFYYIKKGISDYRKNLHGKFEG